MDTEAAGLGRGTAVLLDVIRRGQGTTRADLARRTGLGRAAISQRVERLIERGLVLHGRDLPSTGGRPPSSLVFNGSAGVVLAADLGATHGRLAVADLAGMTLAEAALDLDIADGPRTVLDHVADQFNRLLDEAGRQIRDVRGIGLGVPGPVEFATGRPINPPIMPGWHNFSIPDHLAATFGVPVLVDNDVNIMAVGEHSANWRDERHFLFVKMGTGIGAGIVEEGKILRGAQGAAGDIGHIPVAGHDDVICQCGNAGCLEAVAGGRALADAARALGFDARNSRDVAELARAQTAEIVHLIRESGRLLGGVLAGLVHTLNPSVIVIGGDLAEAHDLLFAGVREVVYRRASPLATRDLRIVHSKLGDRDGITGAAALITEHVLLQEIADGGP